MMPIIATMISDAVRIRPLSASAMSVARLVLIHDAGMRRSRVRTRRRSLGPGCSHNFVADLRAGRIFSDL